MNDLTSAGNDVGKGVARGKSVSVGDFCRLAKISDAPNPTLCGGGHIPTMRHPSRNANRKRQAPFEPAEKTYRFLLSKSVNTYNNVLISVKQIHISFYYT